MKLTDELIDLSLENALEPAQAAELKAWLKGHPADAAKLERARKLRSKLMASKPVPSAAQSRRMWAAIQAQTGAAAARGPVLEFSEPWYAFFTRPWALGGGLATGLAALLLVMWQPWNSVPPSPTEAPLVEAEATPMAVAPTTRSLAKKEAAAEPMLAKAEAPMAASAPAPADDMAAVEEDRGPTEVEKALADSGLDGMIDNYLAQQKTASRSSLAMKRSAPSLGGGAALASAGALSLSRSESAMPMQDAATHGGRDENGFWDWQAAAIAMNRRDWGQAKLELLAARSQATEASERAFATSALTLLSAPGAPLADQLESVPKLGELRVLGAGRWQLLVGKRLAQFGEGVSARLPGFRTEGDSLVLDMTFDRGTFSPGTRFVRLSGETAAQVYDAQGRALQADEFSATGGAVYHVSGKELRLR